MTTTRSDPAEIKVHPALPAIVIGSGWGRHAAEALASDERVCLVGIVGRGSARTAALAKELEVTAYENLEVALEEIKPTLACVAATSEHHPKLVRQLFAAGCDVLCAHPATPTGEDALQLATEAEESGRLLATDYTLPLTKAFEVANEATHKLGGPLRISAHAPGRALIMNIELAVRLAGPVLRTLGSRHYPAHLKERIRRTPWAFAPSVLLEHVAGCTTAITPVPHLSAACAHRLVISTERGSIEAELPRGGVRVLRRGREGTSEDVLLPPDTSRSDPASAVSAQEAFGKPMRRLVQEFVTSVLGRSSTLADFRYEAHLRDIWHALAKSCPESTFVDVARHPT